MGISIDMMAVTSLVYQLNSIESEALCIMSRLAGLSAQKTNLQNQLLDNNSMKALMPARSDFYYTVSTGTYNGQDFSIDSRYQDYSAMTTSTIAGVGLQTSTTQVGTTLKSTRSLPMTYSGRFLGSQINLDQNKYTSKCEDKEPTGYMAYVQIVDPTQYYNKKSEKTEKDEDGNEKTVYDKASADTPLSDLCDVSGEECICGGVSAFTIKELEAMGAKMASGESTTGEALSASPYAKIYIPGDAGKNITGAEPVIETENGKNAAAEALSTGNLYVLESGNSCRKATKEDLENPEGLTFIQKLAATNTTTGKYYVDKDEPDEVRIDGNSLMSFAQAQEQGVPVDQLMEAALHHCSTCRTADDKPYTEQDIYERFSVIKVGDEWGLVENKAVDERRENKATSIQAYIVDSEGMYQTSGGEIPAHHLSIDAQGNLKSFQVGEGSELQSISVDTKTYFDQEGYDKAVDEYNYNVKVSEIEANNLEKQINELAQEDADMEARLTYLDSQKKVVEGFLEAAKSLAKSDAERLGKAFSG